MAGWINVDRSPNVLLDRLPIVKPALLRIGVLSDGHRKGWDRGVVRHDIRRLPYATDSVDYVYSSHTLEHLFFSEAEAVLAEVARVLRPTGRVRLALPDASQWARDLLSDVDSYESGRVFNQRLLAHPDVKPRTLARLREMAGGHVHRWQPTPALAEGMLSAAGFTDVRRCSFRSGHVPDLENVETREESFFVEAALG